MEIDSLPFLRLLQLADSAVPIGATAHSFGLETLVADALLEPALLEDFLREYLLENGCFEATCCRLGYRVLAALDQQETLNHWWMINDIMSAWKTARESRQASATLGRRLLQLLHTLQPTELCAIIQREAKQRRSDTHHSPTFGLVGAILEVSEEMTVQAYLQQSLQGLIFVFQRVLPVGQQQASSLSWDLKPTILEVSERSRDLAMHSRELALLTPLPEIGSMRHPSLTMRLFIS